MKPTVNLCWPNIAFILTICLLGFISMLSACGQSGALYLPKTTMPTEANTESVDQENTEKEQAK